jgi:hypothetical protein
MVREIGLRMKLKYLVCYNVFCLWWIFSPIHPDLFTTEQGMGIYQWVFAYSVINGLKKPLKMNINVHYM